MFFNRCGAPATAGLLTTLLCVVSVVHAVEPPTPGTVREPFNRPVQPPATGELPAIKQEEPATTRPKSAKRILVNRFELEGNRAFSDEELISQIASLRGQELTLDEIYAAAEILTDYYRTRGYSLAKVSVPAQRINFGVIRMRVSEGRINEVSFDGNESYEDEFLRPYFDSFKTGDAITITSLEEELLLVNDLPGLEARAILRPGPEFGTSDLMLKTKEKRFEGEISFNNFGRQEVGEWRLEAIGRVNNVSGNGDQFALSVTRTEQNLLRYVSASYNAPIGSNGMRAGISASTIEFDVGGEFAELEIEGDTTDAQVTLSYPLQRSQRQNILVGLSYGRNDSETRTLGVITRDDDINLFEFNILANKVHSNNAITTAQAKLATNFNDNNNDTETDAQKAKLTIEAEHLLPITNDWSLYARARGAVSAQVLADSEKFSIGGQGSVRGFPAAEARGDSGYDVTLEVRRLVVLDGGLPISFRGFIDHGRVFRRKPDATLDDSEALSSAGIGMTMLMGKYITADLEYAEPINAPEEVSDDHEEGRVWFNVTAKF